MTDLEQAIYDAEDACQTKVGLGSIRQIERDTLEALIDAARTVVTPADDIGLLHHVAGLIAEQDGGDVYNPAPCHLDGARAVIAFFANRALSSGASA